MPEPILDPVVLSRVLVGRAREIASLERALDSARAGSGRCVVVGGEAGVGKSRLIAETRERAARSGFLVVVGACFEPDRAFPYAALVDALRSLLGPRSGTEIEDLLGPLAPEIVKLVPELTLAIPGLAPTPLLDPEAEKRRSFESLARFFVRIADRQPLVLILEDLHWSDDLTLEFLHLFLRRLGPHRMLLLVSHRPEEAPPELTHLLGQLRRERLPEEIVLAPLSREHSDELVRSILDPSGPGAADFLERVHAMTEGNPFAIEEMLKSLVDAGQVRRAAAGWTPVRAGDVQVPRSVRDAVQHRIARLSAVERDVLTVAVVAGRRFEFGVLQDAAGLSEPELLEVIKALIAAQLVVEEAPNRFAFRHALTREAIYALLLGRERQTLHRRVADALERVHADDADRHAADLGQHFHAAEAWEPALRYARRAGEQAQALNAPRAAVEHYNRALDAAERLGRSLPVDLLRARGRAYETIGYFEAARADYEGATETSKAAGDVRAEWAGLIALGRLWASRDYARTGRYFRDALELARGLGDAGTLATSLNRLGNWHANVAEPGEALRDHAEALELFESAGDRRGVVETLDLIGMASQLSAQLSNAHGAYLRATEVWRQLGDARGLSATLSSMPLCSSLYVHELDVPAITLREAARAAEEGVRLAREIGWRAGEAYGQFNLAMTLGPLGELGRALGAAGAALAIAQEIEHRQWTTGGHAVLGMVHLDALDSKTAVTHLERALELAGAIGSRVWTGTVTGFLAVAYTEQRQLERAEQLLEDALAEGTPMRTQTQRLCWYARGELALARDEGEAALAIADGLIATAIRPNGVRPDDVVIPRLGLLRGTALARIGDTDAATRVLEAASSAASDRGMRSLLWRIEGMLARVHGRARRREEARARLAAARGCVEEMAAEMPEDPVRSEWMARSTAALPKQRTPTRARAEKERFGGLSARQREVAALVARGLSNKAMADELGVGLRTVEAHVTQVLMKLGFSSRSQVAAWAVETGLDKSLAAPPVTSAGRR